MGLLQVVKREHDIEARALEVLTHAKALSVPVDLDRVAMSCGAAVHTQVLEDQVSGALVVKDGENHILVNSTHHPNRQRFTIAHELGHLVLHAAHVDRLFIDTQLRVYRRTGESGAQVYQAPESTTTPEEERQANQFAAGLLMPRVLLLEILDSNRVVDEHDVSDLARAFGVSEQAMSIRLQRLGLVELEQD
jgi:Predicted Zn peptidase